MKVTQKKNWKLELVLTSLMGLGFAASGCMPTAGTPYYEMVKGLDALKLRGHVIQNGIPYANRSMTVTSTAYYAKLGINQTFNAGVQTDAQGNFEVDTTVMLCAARPDFVEFTRRVIETDRTESDWMAGAILLPGLVVGGSGGESHTVTREFSTKRIPRSICNNFDPTKNEFAFVLGAPVVEYDDMMGDRGERAKAAAFAKQWAIVTGTDETPRMRAGLRNEITPLELGVISLDRKSATNGLITGTQIELMYEGPIAFVTQPDSKTGKDVATYGWSAAQTYRLVVESQFDLSRPTDQAPGQLARAKKTPRLSEEREI